MQAVLHHGAGQEAHAHQQVAGGVGIVREQRDVILSLGAGDLHYREQEDRQQRCERDRHGLSDPKDHHQYPLPHQRQPFRRRHEADDQHGNDADKEADLLDFCFTHGISS